MSVGDLALLGLPDVSRETLEALEQFLELVRKWNPAINLVAPASLTEGWTRHMADSLQLWALAGAKAGLWLDLGSGGGFPGLPIAILARELAPELRVALVDSDARKCVFLGQAARSLGVKVEVHKARIGSLPPMEADFLSARALAPLTDLLHFAARHLRPDGVALFLKGKAAQEEIAEARKIWEFDCEERPSLTDPAGVVLMIRNIRNG